MPNLYEVEVTYRGVVFAATYKEAMEFADKVTFTERPDIDVVPLEITLPPGWDEDTLVYHNGGIDMTVSQARKLAEYTD